MLTKSKVEVVIALKVNYTEGISLEVRSLIVKDFKMHVNHVSNHTHACQSGKIPEKK